VVFLLGSPQVVGAQTGRAMPDGCAQNLVQCSLQVWPKNSFPHTGSQYSVTFSNGATLDCTSNGRNVPRAAR